MRVESEAAVRYVRIDRGNEPRDGPYFILVYLAGHKESAGYEEGRIGSLPDICSHPGEVFYHSFIRNSRQALGHFLLSGGQILSDHFFLHNELVE